MLFDLRKSVLYLLLLLAPRFLSQETSVQKGDVALNVNIGTPHIFKALTKAVIKSQPFKDIFSGYVEIGNVTGMNPIIVKGEYTFNKWFALGLNYGTWKVGFDVTDHYNLQRQTAGQVLRDSVDVYKVTISSTSFGIRPVFHLNLKDRKNNFYFAFAFGITNNNLGLSFQSTDAGRTLGPVGTLLSQDLPIGGGMYFAPTIGYRHYFNSWLGLNIEAGYDKGALLLGGLAIRFNVLKKHSGS